MRVAVELARACLMLRHSHALVLLFGLLWSSERRKGRLHFRIPSRGLIAFGFGRPREPLPATSWRRAAPDIGHLLPFCYL